MRKLAIACALAAAALFAQGARAESTAESTGDKVKQGASDAAGATRKTGERWKEAGDRALNGKGSSGSTDQTAQNTKAEKKHPLFDGKHNYDLDGKVQKVSKNSITISRQDLPAATLSVSQGTRVQLDGDDVSIERLQAGQDVKASFNLDKQKPEAVEIKAQRSDAEKDAQKK